MAEFSVSARLASSPVSLMRPGGGRRVARGFRRRGSGSSARHQNKPEPDEQKHGNISMSTYADLPLGNQKELMPWSGFSSDHGFAERQGAAAGSHGKCLEGDALDRPVGSAARATSFMAAARSGPSPACRSASPGAVTSLSRTEVDRRSRLDRPAISANQGNSPGTASTPGTLAATHARRRRAKA